MPAKLPNNRDKIKFRIRAMKRNLRELKDDSARLGQMIGALTAQQSEVTKSLEFISDQFHALQEDVGLELQNMKVIDDASEAVN
jgi:predicted  nucleic acid-binding Zn-ribbon protein